MSNCCHVSTSCRIPGVQARLISGAVKPYPVGEDMGLGRHRQGQVHGDQWTWADIDNMGIESDMDMDVTWSDININMGMGIE